MGARSGGQRLNQGAEQRLSSSAGIVNECYTTLGDLNRSCDNATVRHLVTPFHIIWLLSQGRWAKFVAEVTGYTPTWVSKILWRYNDHGLAGLGDPLTNEPIVNQYFETLEELDEVLAERCRILAEDQDQITAHTLFEWWPQHHQQSVETDIKCFPSIRSRGKRMRTCLLEGLLNQDSNYY
jgi:hypothetical protein